MSYVESLDPVRHILHDHKASGSCSHIRMTHQMDELSATIFFFLDFPLKSHPSIPSIYRRNGEQGLEGFLDLRTPKLSLTRLEREPGAFPAFPRRIMICLGWEWYGVHAAFHFRDIPRLSLRSVTTRMQVQCAQ